jgi:hypothetical protein
MSLHQKQYEEPEAIEVDPRTLHAHIQVLRESLLEMVEKGEGCVTGSTSCAPDCCRYGHAQKVLRDTAMLYFPS